MTTFHEQGLKGQFLIAMPGMGDPRFAKSVVYICDHSDEGAMGVIINKPSKDIKFQELLDQLSITATTSVSDVDIYFGGPVEMGRGFVLHSNDYHIDGSTMHAGDSVGMTATLDVIKDIARGDGPENALFALGYAGWAPSQLEGELAQNGWLTVPADQAILFDVETDDKWQAAIELLGIDPLLLSAEGGRA